MNTALGRTVAATAAFSLAGLASLLFFATFSAYLLPQAVFYTILVLNTFFSVRFFSDILAPSPRQMAVDAVLILLYLMLAYYLGNAVEFPLVATVLFAVASLKYLIELGSNPHTAVLKRKIRLDLLGTVLCAASLGAALTGYPLESAWALAVIFAIANVYLLMIRPMYRL